MPIEHSVRTPGTASTVHTLEANYRTSVFDRVVTNPPPTPEPEPEPEPEPGGLFTADSTVITADSTTRTADEMG
jgi:hypothetical protein